MLAVRFMNVKTSLSERPSANFAHYDETAAHQTGAGQRPGCPFRDELSLPSERLARSQCQPLVHQAAPHNQRGNPFWRAGEPLMMKHPEVRQRFKTSCYFQSHIAWEMSIARVTCSTSVVEYVTETVSRMFDRADPMVKARQDLVLHVALFGAAIYAMHRYGHKLAV